MPVCNAFPVLGHVRLPCRGYVALAVTFTMLCWLVPRRSFCCYFIVLYNDGGSRLNTNK